MFSAGCGSRDLRGMMCRYAWTIGVGIMRRCHLHLGGSFEEIAASEQAARNGRHADSPVVLLAQPSLFDPSRAPQTYGVGVLPRS